MSVRFRRANPKKPVRRVHSESQLKSSPLLSSCVLCTQTQRNLEGTSFRRRCTSYDHTWYRVLVAQPSPFSSLVHLCHLPIPCSEPLSSLPPAFSPRPRPGPRCVWVSLHEPGCQRLACAKLTCKHRYVLVSVSLVQAPFAVRAASNLAGSPVTGAGRDNVRHLSWKRKPLSLVAL